MQSITVQSHIGEDGILRLQIPVGIKDVDVQVTLALQETTINGAAKSSEDLAWPPGYLETAIGSWQGEFPTDRAEQDQSGEVTTHTHMTIDELEAQAQSNGWPPGFFRQTVGAWQGEPLKRPEQGEYEKRDELL